MMKAKVGNWHRATLSVRVFLAYWEEMDEEQKEDNALKNFWKLLKSF